MNPILWRLGRGGRNEFQRVLKEEPLRVVVLIGVMLILTLFIAGAGILVLLWLDGEQYRPIKARLIESLLGMFFFALFFLVSFSNLIVMWTATFASGSALHQAQLPMSDRQLYWGAVIEGGTWASWAGIVLGIPLLAVLGMEAAQPVLFVAAGLAVGAVFMVMCASVGALGNLLVSGLIPVLRRHVRALLVLAALLVVVLTILIISGFEQSGDAPGFMRQVIGSIAFTENPLLPSAWMQIAIADALRSRWDGYGYYLTLMISTALALFIVGEWVASLRLRTLLDGMVGRDDRGHKRARKHRSWTTLPFLGQELGLLVAKDLRMFRRDPAQILHFALYFGLLGFYILMLPRIQKVLEFNGSWRPVLAILNITAVSMALATFTGRFVFPLLSNEGRRLWITVLAPWPRERVVQAKFAFALLVGMPVSSGLVALSGWMLELEPQIIAYQAFVTACMAVGLSAASLGMGAAMADYREDNQAKLAAGYGGTINLMISLFYVGLLLIGAAAPMFLYYYRWAFPVSILWVLGLTVVWSWFGLKIAHRFFARANG